MRTVVITGVSRGLGAALAAQLRARGDRVVGVGRSAADLTADLADPAQVPTAADLAPLLEDADEVALVHNAAVVEPIGPVGTLGADALANAVAVNLTAPMVLTDAFLAAVPAEASRVTVVFVSSGAAHRVVEHWAAYSATKRAGEFFLEVLAAEAARRDPRVTVASVNPGVMDTGMQAEVRSSEFPARERYQRLHEAGELPDPAEVAARIVAEHLTGG
ncbi:SDR family NAD(P)-dependent oxidoreductase [Spirilliplanes yamanashiensis]|uniref:Short-chain dehydrogenase/reductase n=1 Tax=Spirilliplanes yamanashiensis TaxID=42233 RepID=A0A8J3Y4F0_9ACTN|nr:SDR family NAD(P)-dependent oxidoreductase [Spirilliplanes yamanashiensis]MDP9819884.1 NAD(P)-dependent dehydrogenase (short-subunit alcohol dehydrogenase family) [Spirilliplanes yamanashiensis]GIJ01297.1 short-chain dehydrogenase/reductase [Spirilliplanes yamanashiensis]